MPARGLKVKALTSRPLRERRRSAADERLVWKRSVTAQPADVRTTIGRPRLRTANVPAAPTVGIFWVVPGVKDAVTAFAVLIVSVQTVPEPLQLPPQPANVAPEAGIAVSVTVVFAAKEL